MKWPEQANPHKQKVDCGCRELGRMGWWQGLRDDSKWHRVSFYFKCLKFIFNLILN
jgi:hypothetical protein